MADLARFGKRVRRLRERLGLTQVEMARRLAMSASYLNLIEHDQRPLTAKLLSRLDDAFNIDLNAFSETEDARIGADLAEVMADPMFASRSIAVSEVRDLVGASADFGRAVLDLYRAYRQACQEAESLSEELRNREELAGISYEFRNIVASIRSFAEILRDNPELDTEQRRRFVGIIVEDSKRLVPLFGGLLRMDAGTDTPSAADQRPPSEDVADFLQTQAGYFPDLEDAAAGLRGAAEVDQAAEYGRLAACLARDHHIVVRIVPVEAKDLAVNHAVEGRRLDIPEMLSPQARVFAVAKTLAEERCGEAIARCADTVRWASREARTLALSALADYVAGALLMPYDHILAAARELRHDVDRLQRRFGVGFEQVCRRLTALQRPGAKGTPFHIVKVDMAGNVTWRLGGSGIRVPRYGGICPLWNVHAAFLTPGVTRAQLSRMPDGTTYFSVARAIRAEGSETIRLPRFCAIELGCDVAFARDIVYADGLELGAGAVSIPVGTTCRLCERLDCAERVLPPFRQPAKMAAEGSAPAAG